MARTVWEQWDRQTNVSQAAWLELNNLFLQIERGQTVLTIHSANQLRTLVGIAYQTDGNAMVSTMQNYWQNSFEQLPGWSDV